MKYVIKTLLTIIVARFVMKVVDRIKHPEALRREYEEAERYRKKLEWERRQGERRQGRVPHSIDDRKLMQAESHRYDGPKVAAEGCAIGRA